MKVIVLGAGLQGIATAMDLAWNENMEAVTIADYEFERAEKVAKICNDKYGPKVTPIHLDVSDFDALVEAITPFDVVINVVNYYWNVQVMKACLKAKKHYMDLGGLYVESVKQLKFSVAYMIASALVSKESPQPFPFVLSTSILSKSSKSV